MSSSKKLVETQIEARKDDIRKEYFKKYRKKSEFIRDSLILYIKDKKKLNKIEELKKGYIEMAQINLDICEMGFAEDMLVLKEYEAKLAESDLPDDNGSEKRRYILC
jgi:CopG family transcriptional regulator/antitoxin EndoAI